VTGISDTLQSLNVEGWSYEFEMWDVDPSYSRWAWMTDESAAA